MAKRSEESHRIMDANLRGAVFGRRKGKRLRSRQAGLFATLLPRLQIDLTRPAPADPKTLFPRPVSSLRLEIGFGGAEHLLAEAERAPGTGFIGVEPFVNGMAKALSAISRSGIDTIRLHHGDAADLIDWLPSGSLAAIDLLYPDPWPKRRHHKRRFVSADRLTRLARVLEEGGELRFATDIDDYAAWTLRHVLAHPDFEWTAECADDWRLPWRDWPGTRYEAKALRQGRRPVYLTFRRVGGAGACLPASGAEDGALRRPEA